jgi:hypothetical protein
MTFCFGMVIATTKQQVELQVEIVVLFNYPSHLAGLFVLKVNQTS